MNRDIPLKVYQTIAHPEGESAVPVYIIDRGRFYRMVDHHRGWSERPDYKLNSAGFVYRTRFHPLGSSEDPDYRMQKNGCLYQTGNHPQGPTKLPVYQVKD